MNVANLISLKRDGAELNEEQIRFLIEGYTSGEIPDYQMSAWAMAVFFQGLNPTETALLTRSMVDSGTRLVWPDQPPPVDKHSTGGVGDKISIILAPLLACCGVAVPMISGRGLGATGGTLDKLESIPGYRCDLSNDEFRSIVHFHGCSIAGASDTLAPADRKLYALRDVTATVPSIPLITASILSKKVAEGIKALMLDVKWGSGAFMQTQEQAEQLARSLVQVGEELGVATRARLTDMNQPLGRMIGNAVEIDEAVEVLDGRGPQDVRELTLNLAVELLLMAKVETARASAEATAARQLDTGAALDRLKEMVKSHGGDLDAPREIATVHPVAATEAGFVHRIETRRLGLAVIELGGGRKKLADQLDHATGIEFLVRIGDQVEPGQLLARVFARPQSAEYACQLVRGSVGLAPIPAEAPPLLGPLITANSQNPTDDHD